jgi:hypothetical protein
MGFRREPKHFKLIFEDEDMQGFECICRSLSLGEYIETIRLGTAVTDGTVTSGAVEKQFMVFAGALVSWNLEDGHGHPVPATLKEIKKQDIDFITQIIKAWMQAIAGVDENLSNASGSGETSPEASLRLASLSRSQAS